jgi:hypothetical protein
MKMEGRAADHPVVTMPGHRRGGKLAVVRRPSIRRRRRRNRVLRSVEQTWLRIAAAVWVARFLVRHRLAGR